MVAIYPIIYDVCFIHSRWLFGSSSIISSRLKSWKNGNVKKKGKEKRETTLYQLIRKGWFCAATVANNGSNFFSFNLSELPAGCAHFGMEPSRNRKLQPSPETHPIAGQEPKIVSPTSQHIIEEIAMHYFNTMSVRILWYTGTNEKILYHRSVGKKTQIN